jgi:hypothetical protein
MNDSRVIRVSMVLFSTGPGILLFGFLLATGFTLPAQAAAGVHYVAPGGVCGAAISPCYSSVQAAVDAAGDGEEIRVAAGTYTDIHSLESVTQVVYLSKTVTIQGGYTTSDWTSSDPTSNPTILDAQSQGRVLYITGDISPTIDGLNITGGDATGLGGAFFDEDSGGGIYISEAPAIIENCVVFGNSAHDGGGIHVYQSAAIVQGSIISDNVAVNTGGGLLLQYSNARIYANSFFSNTAAQGGASYLYWDGSMLENNTIANNGTAYMNGGGLYLQGGHNTLFNNVIEYNNANDGGGLFIVNATAKIYSNKILSNFTSGQGGGIWIMAGTPVFFNNVIANNSVSDDYSGNALYVKSGSPNMVHNTIINNTSSNGASIQIDNYPGEQYSWR